MKWCSVGYLWNKEWRWNENRRKKIVWLDWILEKSDRNERKEIDKEFGLFNALKWMNFMWKCFRWFLILDEKKKWNEKHKSVTHNYVPSNRCFFMFMFNDGPIVESFIVCLENMQLNFIITTELSAMNLNNAQKYIIQSSELRIFFLENLFHAYLKTINTDLQSKQNR